MATITFDIADEKALELSDLFQQRLNYQGDLSTVTKKRQFVNKAVKREMLLLVQAYRNELARIEVQAAIQQDPEFTNDPLEAELKAQTPLPQQ